MRRTQLYLEDDVWLALRLKAKEEGSTISELVRQAVRDRYLGSHDAREKAMLAFVGCMTDRQDIKDSTEYVRNLRRGSRLEKLFDK